MTEKYTPGGPVRRPIHDGDRKPWYRRDPAPSWVPRLGQFVAAMLVGGVIGFGFGLAAR
jgi:hypothetical protein